MMSFSHRLKAPPLRLLLYLEWILFIISILGQFRLPNIPVPPLEIPPFFPAMNPDFSPISFLFAIVFLILGIYQPNDKHQGNIIYIGLGFILIALTEISSETRANASN